MSLPYDAGLALARPDVRGRRQGRTEDVAAAAGPVCRFEARLHWAPAAVEDIWRRFETEGVSTAYQRFDWVACMCDHLVAAAGVKPFVVEVRDAGTSESLMLLPLALSRRFGISVVSWLNLGVCEYATPLLAPGLVLSADEANAAWAAVRDALPKADLIDVRQIPLEIKATRNPLALLPRLRLMDIKTYGIPIQGDAKTFVPRQLPPGAYRELSKKQRRSERRGEVLLVEAKTEAQLSELFATMLDQRLRRFQDLGRFDLLARPEVIAFYYDAALRSLQNGGSVRLFGLSIAGEWVATNYVLVHNEVLHGVILTIAGGEWKNYSAGMAIATRLMQWSCAQGHTFFDLTVGNLGYKKDLGASSRDLYRLVEAKSWLGFIAMHALDAEARLHAFIRSKPQLYQNLQSLRRQLRRLLARRSADGGQGIAQDHR